MSELLGNEGGVRAREAKLRVPQRPKTLVQGGPMDGAGTAVVGHGHAVNVGVVAVGKNGMRRLVVGAEENLVIAAHGYSATSSVGSASGALARLRMVSGYAPLLPFCSLQMKFRWTPLPRERSPINHTLWRCSLRSFCPSTSVTACVTIARDSSKTYALQDWSEVEIRLYPPPRSHAAAELAISQTWSGTHTTTSPTVPTS